jgi:transcriptional regulator with XRE-family HTH domain
MSMKSTYSQRYEMFREALKQARLDQGLTQKAVAERLNVPRSFVSKYENGDRRLDVVEFIAAAKALDMDYHGILINAGL